MLVSFSFSNGGDTVELELSRWTEDVNGSCEAAGGGPCWGPLTPLSGVVAEGAVNVVPVFDPIEGVTLPIKTFGEAAINLTAAGVFDRDDCVTFGKAFVKSRSSSSFTSQMKDTIQPVDVSVTNCATITIHKNAVPDDAQDFSFAVSSELGPGFDLDDDGDDSNGLAHSYVIEVLSRSEAP